MLSRQKIISWSLWSRIQSNGNVVECRQKPQTPRSLVYDQAYNPTWYYTGWSKIPANGLGLKYFTWIDKFSQIFTNFHIFPRIFTNFREFQRSTVCGSRSIRSRIFYTYWYKCYTFRVIIAIFPFYFINNFYFPLSYGKYQLSTNARNQIFLYLTAYKPSFNHLFHSFLRRNAS